MHQHMHSHGDSHSLQAGSGQIRRIARIGIGLNIFLSVLQLVVGYLVGSLALITDGIHTLSDMFSDVAVMIGVYFGSKAPDLEHPWGHGRMETFTAAIIAGLLMAVGGGMIYKSITSMYQGYVTRPSWSILAVASLCVISKEWLYWMTRAVAKRTNSTALYASAWHHRSDALSSIAVVMGFVALKFGFGHGDQLAAIIVGIMVIMVGVRIFNECLSEFAERAVDEEVIKDIKAVIAEDPRIRGFHKLRTRTVGREIFIDLHILVDPALNLVEAHDIAEELDVDIKRHIDKPVNILIHVEPDTPEIRELGKNL